MQKPYNTLLQAMQTP